MNPIPIDFFQSLHDEVATLVPFGVDQRNLQAMKEKISSAEKMAKSTDGSDVYSSIVDLVGELGVLTLKNEIDISYTPINTLVQRCLQAIDPFRPIAENLVSLAVQNCLRRRKASQELAENDQRSFPKETRSSPAPRPEEGLAPSAVTSRSQEEQLSPEDRTRIEAMIKAWTSDLESFPEEVAKTPVSTEATESMQKITAAHARGIIEYLQTFYTQSPSDSSSSSSSATSRPVSSRDDHGRRDFCAPKFAQVSKEELSNAIDALQWRIRYFRRIIEFLTPSEEVHAKQSATMNAIQAELVSRIGQLCTQLEGLLKQAENKMSELIETSSDLSTITFPFSDPQAKHLSDGEALEEMIGFLEKLNQLSVQSIVGTEVSRGLLSVQEELIRPRLEECIDQLSLELSCVPPSEAHATVNSPTQRPDGEDSIAQTGALRREQRFRFSISNLTSGNPKEDRPLSEREILKQMIEFWDKIDSGCSECINQINGLNRPPLQKMSKIFHLYLGNLLICLRGRLERFPTASSSGSLSDSFQELSAAVQQLKEFCTNPETRNELQRSLESLKLQFTRTSCPPTYKISLADFTAALRREEDLKIRKTELPSLLKDLYERCTGVYPTDDEEDEEDDDACSPVGFHPQQRVHNSPELPKRRPSIEDISSVDDVSEFFHLAREQGLQGRSSRGEPFDGESEEPSLLALLSSIPFPFSDLKAKDFTDQQVLQKMIEFLVLRDEDISKFVKESEDLTETLHMMQTFLHSHFQQCQDDLRGLLLSLSPSSTPKAPEMGSSPPTAVPVSDCDDKLVGGIAALSLTEGNQRAGKVLSRVKVEKTVKGIILFLDRIRSEWKKYYSKIAPDRPLLESMDQSINELLQASRNDLGDLLHQDQIEQPPLALSSSSSTSSTAQAAGFPQIAVERGTNRKGSEKFFSELLIAVYELNVDEEHRYEMASAVRQAQSMHVTDQTLARLILATLVGNLSFQLWTSSSQQNIRDTSIPALVRKYYRDLYPSQANNDEGQLVERMIRYWHEVYKLVLDIRDIPQTQDDVIRIITESVNECIRCLEYRGATLSQEQLCSGNCTSHVSAFPASQDIALRQYVLGEGPLTKKERILEMVKLFSLIDGETAILCADEAQETTVRLFVKKVILNCVSACLTPLLKEIGKN